MLVTGGAEQTLAGGCITIVYFLTIFCIMLGLLQEQIGVNEWIDSTQMASQSSELLVSNTLFVETKLYVTQIPLSGMSKNNSATTNLCDLSVLSLTMSKKADDSDLKTEHPIELFSCAKQMISGTSGFEFVYQVNFVLDHFILDDSHEQRSMNLAFQSLKEVANETIMLNFFDYSVQTRWNSIDGMERGDEDIIQAFLDSNLAEDCQGCSKFAGKSSVEDYGRHSYPRDCQVNLNLKAAPVYYQNSLRYESYSGYLLQFLSMRYFTDESPAELFGPTQARELGERDFSLHLNVDGTYKQFAPLTFSNDTSHLKTLLMQYSGQRGSLLDLLWSQQQAQDNKPPLPAKSSFTINYRFTLSESITQVRVMKRKSWSSTLAEILAFIAGLAFNAKLMKYVFSRESITSVFAKLGEAYFGEDDK